MANSPQLQPLRFCSRCGAPVQPALAHGRLRPVCTSCGFVVYEAPKVASGALITDAGRVLLVRRRNQPGRGRWCLPCGFAEADEPPELAARREVREECGLNVDVGRLLGAYHYTDDPRGAGILLVYVASVAGGALQAGDDADDIGFFALDSLPPLSHHTHARALADWGQLERSISHE